MLHNCKPVTFKIKYIKVFRRVMNRRILRTSVAVCTRHCFRWRTSSSFRVRCNNTRYSFRCWSSRFYYSRIPNLSKVKIAALAGHGEAQGLASEPPLHDARDVQGPLALHGDGSFWACQSRGGNSRQRNLFHQVSCEPCFKFDRCFPSPKLQQCEMTRTPFVLRRCYVLIYCGEIITVNRTLFDIHNPITL